MMLASFQKRAPTAVAYVEATVSALARYITEKCVVLDALRSEVGVCSTFV